MIDLSGYTQAALQEEMLKQVPDDIDKRQGSIIPVSYTHLDVYKRQG